MTATEKARNFLEQIIEKDLAEGRVSRIHTRFPPEPNGFLHVGHATSICLNFGLAEKYQGECNLRFDDTNPEKEEQVYVDAIQEDIRWLGFQWSGEVRYASSYFDQFYDWALHLIRAGKAYVDHQDAEAMRVNRGDFNKPGVESPDRNKSVEENLAEFAKMRAGDYEEGKASLRAKIDMQSPNMNMRDPVLYRIRKVPHHQTGDKWCIYPSYDFAHGQEDAIEHITHSICTLEFQDHRPLYEWFLDNLPVPARPRQYEFARTNLNYTVTSKRKLKKLVDEGVVNGWDDPRMPTISGMRRRGYTPAAIRRFSEMAGVSRSDGTADVSMLEHAIRDDLNTNAARAMAVLSPLKLVIQNLPEGEVQEMAAATHPNRPELGQRTLPFTREIYIDQEDFTEDTTLSRKKFKRLVIGDYVRLRSAYVIKAEAVIRDESGNIVEVHASYVPGTVGEDPPEGIRPRGVIHWVSATHGQQAELRIYDRLFSHPAPDRGEEDFLSHVNPDSLKVTQAWLEPSLVNAAPEQSFQFEREGYFVADRRDHCVEHPVFNLTIGLKDTWANK
ncbi:glutamine--tRNA ligase/YqeY domain fusion protein [Endozoicomonas sp. GU-1]|uniref:glutamine--tRNA ligase/YqeY domain fusion protein n=1 Tax=Endozoicomonas sp. GU-1 TaxID=3009078 RepID=UPI0022B3540F|nr:glutamine--tRNA ligase/YqeY domain fusion protein [Endozoicomonas sp. GU-1]WBA83698.1 glutamine--tRNA ligase/YqeY domain fusion protein [Endozoicomonas sp. GU-1]WBA86675.1 glutamine--tRNA ligase/YqeY domain fusion protein [Endozoicomonas sp. GU-1]